MGIKQMTLKQFCKGFQVNEKTNPLTGVESRFQLIQRLGEALSSHPEFFGKEVCRPGNVLDYVLKHAKDGRVSIRVLWKAIIEGLESIWPENSAGVKRGDVWVYNPLKVPHTQQKKFHFTPQTNTNPEGTRILRLISMVRTPLTPRSYITP